MKITRETLKQMIAEEIAKLSQNVTEEETQEEVSEAANEGEESVSENEASSTKASMHNLKKIVAEEIVKIELEKMGK